MTPDLEAVLVAAGYMDPDTGATRRARWTTCKCGRRIVRGLDADVMARSADCDARPLSSTGEVLTLLAGQAAGLRTFELRWLGGRAELDFRDQWRITERPAGARTWRGDVLGEHVCGRPWWPATAYLPTRLVIPRWAVPDGSPPF